MRPILLLLILLFLSGCSENVIKPEKVIRPIAWIAVEETNLTQLRTLSGILAPVERASLSFEVIGKVDSVNVQLGETVKKGQRLAQLDHRNFDLNLKSSQAQLNKATTSMADAKSTFDRFQTLIKKALVSQSEFDNAKAAYDSTRSAVDVAQAQFDIANKNLQDSTLLAPYDGIITKRLIEPSQQVGAGQVIFEIEGDLGLEVEVLVPETLIQNLKPNDQLVVRFPVLAGVVAQGRINEIGTRAESANAFPITVMLTQSDDRLRAGMTAEVDFTFDGIGRTGYQGKTIALPLSALSAGLDQKSYVFFYNKQTQRVEKREVQTENILDNKVFISNGLKHGDIIAIAGVSFLRDGQPVTLLDNETKRFN